MSIRQILTFPHPGLRVVAEPVTDFGESVDALAQDLLDTMRDAPGIGITAPHIGIGKRLVVIELEPGAALFYANPEILWASSDVARREEGSVSMPGVSDEVERPASIRVRYQDLSGTIHTQEATGLLATCLQHEIDQLDGIFWTLRLSKLKRDRLIKRFEKLKRSGSR